METISKLSPAKIIAHYESGQLTKADSLHYLVSTLTPENVDVFIGALPSEWIANLRSEVETAPKEDWNGFYICSLSSYINISPEDIHRLERDKLDAYRSGIATLRAYFDDNISS